MAAVLDEHGTTVGVITLEQVLEQLVGDVQDEFDHEVPDLARDSGDSYLVKGSLAIQRVNDELGLKIPDEDANTVSGAIMAAQSRIPRVGDAVALGGAKLEVTEVRANRAERVRIVVREGEAPTGMEDGDV